MLFSDLPVGSIFVTIDVFNVAMDIAKGDEEKALEICKKSHSTKISEETNPNTRTESGNTYFELGNTKVHKF